MNTGLHLVTRSITAARTAYAVSQLQQYRTVVTWQLQRLRMHPGIELEHVIGDREFQWRAELSILVGKGEHNAFLELRGIHRIVEVDGHDGLLCGRILRVLIELALAEICGEFREVENQMITGHQDVRRESLRHIELHFDVHAHRPVFAGSEAQRVIVEPAPFALERRLHRNALAHDLADQFDRRRRTGKGDLQRMDGDLGIAVGLCRVFGDGRCLHLEGNPLGFDRPGPMLIPLPAKPPADEQNQCGEQPTGKMTRAATDRCTGGRSPARRRPGHIPDEWSQD